MDSVVTKHYVTKHQLWCGQPIVNQELFDILVDNVVDNGTMLYFFINIINMNDEISKHNVYIESKEVYSKMEN